MSGKITVRSIVEKAPEGSMFITSDFAGCGSGESVRKFLSRMVTSGELETPMRGMYRKSKTSTFLGVNVPARPDEVAVTLARKFGWNVAPCGDTALNRLGLDTQVPVTYEYVSDGPYRTYAYGNYEIVFRHTANRDLSKMSPATATVVQALKALGRDRVDEKVLEAIASRFDGEQLGKMREESSIATSWVREAIVEMTKGDVAHA